MNFKGTFRVFSFVILAYTWLMAFGPSAQDAIMHDDATEASLRKINNNGK